MRKCLFKIKYLGPLSGHPQIEKLDHKQFIDGYPIQWSNTIWWIVKQQNIIVAYISLEYNKPNKNYVYLARSFVLPQYRGLGIHKRLIKTATMWARRNKYKTIWSSINVWNYASGNSLISCGFKLCKPITDEWTEQLLFFQKAL